MRDGFSAKECSKALLVSETSVTRIMRRVFSRWAAMLVADPEGAYRDLVAAADLIRSGRESAAHPVLVKLAKLHAHDPRSFAIEASEALRMDRIARDHAQRSAAMRSCSRCGAA